LKNCLSTFLFVTLLVIGVLYLRDYLSVVKFSREKWVNQPQSRYGMIDDLKKQLKEKNKNEVFEMIGDFKIDTSENEWNLPLYNGGKLSVDFAMMQIVFKDNKVEKITIRED
jgi:hypothetical protein